MFSKLLSKLSAPWFLVILGCLTVSIVASPFEHIGSVGATKLKKNTKDSASLRQSKEYNGSPNYVKRSIAHSLVKRAVGAVPVSGSPSGQAPCVLPAIAKRAVGSVPDPAQLCERTAPAIHARSLLQARSVATPEIAPVESATASIEQLFRRTPRLSGKPVDQKKWGMARAWKRD